MTPSPSHPVILDISGTALTEVDVPRLTHPLVGGVILFARNFSDRKSLVRLCSSIKDIRPDLLICVDQEGGRVQRFKSDGFTKIPAMRQVGHAAATMGTVIGRSLAVDSGYVLASELRACGVDLSFAPVLDIDYGNSVVIGDRSFGSDFQRVQVLSSEFMKGMAKAGMRNCGKHFPGHGFAAGDSHTEFPVDARKIGDLFEAGDILPFGMDCVASVMLSHIVVPQFSDLPVSLSNKWIDILRGVLGFQGAVISDDLSMRAASMIEGEPLSIAKASARAIQAGCDLVLVCNQSLGSVPPIDQILEDLSALVDPLLLNPLSESRRLALIPDAPAMCWDMLMANEQYQAALKNIDTLTQLGGFNTPARTT